MISSEFEGLAGQVGLSGARNVGLLHIFNGVTAFEQGRGVFVRMLKGLASEGTEQKTIMIDPTYLKARRTASTWGRSNRPGRKACREAAKIVGWTLITQVPSLFMSGS